MNLASSGATSSGVRTDDAAPTGLNHILVLALYKYAAPMALWAGATPKTAAGTGALPGKVPMGGRAQAPFVPGGTLDDGGHRGPATNGWAIFSGARVGSTGSAAPARTAGLDCKAPRPVHALRAEPRVGIGTIRAPGENGVAVGKDRRAGPAGDDKGGLGWTTKSLFLRSPSPFILSPGERK
jgi:hypothetical protein